MPRHIALVVCVFTFAFGSWAQTSLQAQSKIHNMADMYDQRLPYGQIDGSKNPEQVPDAVAFRLWMTNVYPRTNDNPNGQVFTSLLKQVGLSIADDAILRRTIISYNKSLDKIVGSYHQAVLADEEKGAHSADQDSFWRNVYALVSNTMIGLDAQLSEQGQRQFYARLQEHKHAVSVSPYDFGLGPIAQIRKKELNMVASAAGMPQGVNMTPDYSGSWASATSFPTNLVQNSPFYSGWAQDTGSGNGSFSTSNGYVQASSNTGGESNAYWPAGGSATNGVSTMTLETPPSQVSGTTNTIGVRTQISNNGDNFYLATMFGGGSGDNYIKVYKYANNVWTTLGSY